MLEFITGFVIFLFVLSVHECAHAWTANRCGDPTARLQGRMTLNPRTHIDPIGTILLPLSPLIFGAMGGGTGGFISGFRFFGWARPVPVNPLNVRRWRRDNILISLAGPVSGFLIALGSAVILRGVTLVLPYNAAVGGVMGSTLLRLGSISVWLSLFNLIPIPPLDGYHVATQLLRIDPARSASFLQLSGPWLLLLLINTPFLYMLLGPLNALLFGGAFRAIAGV